MVEQTGSHLFCNSLPKYLSEEIEKLQRRDMRVIYPDVTYSDALNLSGLDSLSNRRECLTTRRFDMVMGNPQHRLNQKTEFAINLRAKSSFNAPTCKTKRCRSSSIFSNAATMYQ